MCITAKTKELKKDAEVLSQTFERMVDQKDAIIQSLAKDLEEAEEQYQVALRAHQQNVDSLIGTLPISKYSGLCYNFIIIVTDFQAKRTAKLERDYREELDMLQREFDVERQALLQCKKCILSYSCMCNCRQAMISKHESEGKDLSDVLYAMELRYTEREAEARQEFQSLMDELKNKVCVQSLVLFSLHSSYLLSAESGRHTRFAGPTQVNSR